MSEFDGDHAAVIHRMLGDAPPFRPECAPEELVAEFANGQNRMPAFLALYSRGAAVLPAVRQGLQHANWHIRRWCAILADNFADAETLRALTPLLRESASGSARVGGPFTLLRGMQDGSEPNRRHSLAVGAD